MIQGRWMPQTDEEWQLLEDLYVVTRAAAQDGVSKSRIASALAFQAAAASQQAAFEAHGHAGPAESAQEREEREERGSGPPEGHAASEPEEPMCPVEGCDEPVTQDNCMVGAGLTPFRHAPCDTDLTHYLGKSDARELYEEVYGSGE